MRSNGYDGNANGNGTPAATLGASRVLQNGFLEGGQRHLEGLKVAYVDGHVKWDKSSGINTSTIIWNFSTPFSTSGQNPTFNITSP